MELNALFFHHQTALMNGARLALKASEPGRNGQSGFDLTTYYAKRILEERRRLGHNGHDWTDLACASAKSPSAQSIRND